MSVEHLSPFAIRHLHEEILMSVVTLTINDELVSARSEQSLLAVLKERGIELPTLCHMEGLSERGGCRLCLVEIQGNQKLQPACVTPVQEGAVIYTHSERLIRYRQMILELLLSERNHICAVCVMNGHCELQWQAARLSVDNVRYDYLSPDICHGRQPQPLCHGPQPLHPLHPLCACVRRGGRRPHVGCLWPRGEQPGDRGPEPALGNKQ